MDDPRWEPGMPVLDRQATPGGAHGGMPPAQPRSPDRLVETTPTPLAKHYINLSAIALVAGFIAITALETGSPLSSPLVKLCIVIAAPILVLTTADAALKFWRSARAWLPVNRDRGLFRLTWVGAALLGIVVIVALSAIVLAA